MPYVPPQRSSPDVRSFLEYLFHLIWPVSCPVCGRLAVLVCDACLISLLHPPSPFCLECGGPYPCEEHPKGAPVLAASLYPGKSRKLIASLKYRGGRAIGYKMGVAMGNLFYPPSADFLVPIPLHLESKRGYNQSKLIAEGLSSVWGIPTRDFLRWQHRTKRQTTRTAQERKQISSDAFQTLSGCHGSIVLVDDISTTGSTLQAAAAAIIRDGGSVRGGIVWGRRSR